MIKGNKKKISMALVTVAFITSGVILTGCIGQDNIGSIPSLIQTGSSTVLPLAIAWAEEFDGAEISVSGGGSSHGLNALLNGDADLGDASRLMKSSDYEKIGCSGSLVNDDGTAINTYSPPWKLVDYPLTVGKTWYINYTETSTGGYLGDEVETTDYSMFCECIETNQTTLSKGTFDCYVVKVLTVTDGIKEYRVFYNYFFAPEGGIYPIKMDAYQMGQYVASNNALNDYGSAESDDPVTDDSDDSDNTDDTSSDDLTTEETSNDDSGSGTPGFELIIVFCSIFFVFLWKQRKYKK